MKSKPTILVHNLSSLQLDATEEALAKSFNFAISPSRLPVEVIICGVESAIIGLPDDIAESVCQDTYCILRTSRLLKRNISHAEIQALKALRENEDVIVLPADKGNATVVLDTADYNRKMFTLLEDPAYKQYNADPTTYLEKTTRLKIMASPIDPEVQKISS